MNWLMRNLGLAVLGVCLLAGSASIETRLSVIEAKVDASTALQRKLDYGAQQVAQEIMPVTYHRGRNK